MTLSWDRFANLGVGAYNVKLPSVLFTVAFSLALTSGGARGLRPGLRNPRGLFVLLAIALLAVEVVRGALSAHPAAAAGQVIAVLTGALLPAGAVLQLVRTRRTLEWALRMLLVGFVIAAAFGVYQLTAFYTGLPQGSPTRARASEPGSDGSPPSTTSRRTSPRSSSSRLGALAALRRMQGRALSWRAAAGFAVLLYLVNVPCRPVHRSRARGHDARRLQGRTGRCSCGSQPSAPRYSS